MSNVEEARRKAFKLWTEYDNKAKLSERTVHRLEFLIHGACKGIKTETEKYHRNEEYHELWNEWFVEYTRDIVNRAKSLGFDSERNLIDTLEFDDTKYGLDTFRGVFHRFMLFEESAVKFGLVDELNENGYKTIESLINRCMDYIVCVVDQRILRYQELLEYVEDKRENALKSCREYIYAKLEEK